MANSKTLDDVQIEFTDGTVLICSPKSAVYVLRGLHLTPVTDGKTE